jgi:hypothetical protein|mmetsp:Transcript_14226/g.30561  ORF Transcript_14226/g.30561 Transcript_14226/m.30561 type:complete len:84 (-) Transcript_14226:3172-3423(-)
MEHSSTQINEAIRSKIHGSFKEHFDDTAIVSQQKNYAVRVFNSSSHTMVGLHSASSLAWSICASTNGLVQFSISSYSEELCTI